MSRGVLCLALALAILGAGCADASRFPDPPRHDLRAAREFRLFRLFHAGPSVAGLPLTMDGTSDIRPSYVPGRSVSFGYGFCDLPSGDDAGGCSLPADVQNFPECAENLGRYNGPVRPARFIRLRGRRVAVFEAGGRFDKLLLTTGSTSIDVYADSLARARRVVSRLRSADGRVGPGDPLPKPAHTPPSSRVCA